MGRVSNHHRLLKLQRQIFQSLQAEVESLLGGAPESIHRYEREYLADFRAARRKLPRPITKGELFAAIRGAEVTFVADFHTFPQAQRTLLRLLRETAEGDGGAPSALGLELVSTDHQAALDAFQAGRIDLEEFHRAIHYPKTWGFPWENYAPLFAWARAHSVRLLALNRPLRARPGKKAPSPGTAKRAAKSDDPRTHELYERDRWAAGVIAEHFREKAATGERPRLFVLYGELHLGARHLPARLREAARTLDQVISTVTVYQDNDALFWKLAEKGKEVETEILRLADDRFCVFSGTPWARLRSLIAWTDGEAEDPAGLEKADHLSLMRSDGSAIARFLSVPTPSFESLGAYTIDQADVMESARLRHAFTARERALIRFHVMHSVRIYLPRISAAYLASPSVNSLAEMAAVHMLRGFSGDQRFFDGTVDAFFRQAIEHAFGFFGSLVLNPRRKCDHLADHEHRARLLKSAAAREAFPGERAARALAIRTLRAGSRDRALRRIRPAPGASLREMTSAMMAARYVGELLGKRLHRAALSETIALGQIIELCLEPIMDAGDSQRARYVRLNRLISSATLPRTQRAAL